MADLVAGLEPAALLGRPEATIDTRAARAALAGRRILVTGAGGSVGVPLVERLIDLAPAELVLLDNHEDSLHRLQRRLRKTDAPAILELGDVRDRRGLAALFGRRRPEVVFHLAAYKHVHFGEAQPHEPVALNVLGTHALVEAAVEHGVAVFVYTSSDKAVNPPGIYGATKRLAELVVRWGGQRGAGRHVVVRFVNVLGTRGSVIETFIEQLANGEPLTITDPAMTRYWMSRREAVDLLLVAAAAPGGTTLLLDAGAPVPVVDIARRLHALLGRVDAPLQLESVGRRAGERLAEELASARERLVPGPTAGIWRVAHEDGDAAVAAVPEVLGVLTAALEHQDARLGVQLMALARELQ